MYILTNRAMPDYVKIGFTTKDLDKKMTELLKENSPHPFQLFFAKKVDDYKTVEKDLHFELGTNRSHPTRNFFNLTTQQAFNAVNKHDGDILVNRGRRATVNFYDSLGLKSGDKIAYRHNPRITAVIVDDNLVKSKNIYTNLAGLTYEITDNASITNTLDCWTYKKEILSKRRDRLNK